MDGANEYIDNCNNDNAYIYDGDGETDKSRIIDNDNDDTEDAVITISVPIHKCIDNSLFCNWTVLLACSEQSNDQLYLV